MSIIEQIKQGAEFTFNGYPARYVGARIDPGKIVIEYNAAAGTNAAFWTVSAVSEGIPGLRLVPKKVKFYVNVYRNGDDSYASYTHSERVGAEQAAAECARNGAPAVKIAHEVEIEL
jgi:hypothetical protein